MLKHILLASTLLVTVIAKSQNSSDTVKIQIGQDNISLPMPKDGKKVTVNLEDSTGIIQISIGKMGKNGISPGFLSPPSVSERKSRVTWLREIELGTMLMLSKAKEMRADSMINLNYKDVTSNGNATGTTTFISLRPERIKPGLTFGINIKEKRRHLGTSKYTLLTGFKFRYTSFSAEGQYQESEYKSRMVNGVNKYYLDSLVSYKYGDYNSTTRNFQIVFPVMVEFPTKRDDFTIAAGVNIALGINSSKIYKSNGENLKTTSLIFLYTDPQILQFQPAVRFNYKRMSAHVSASLNSTRIGYGATEHVNGNMWFFGLGYKIY